MAWASTAPYRSIQVRGHAHGPDVPIADQHRVGAGHLRGAGAQRRVKLRRAGLPRPRIAGHEHTRLIEHAGMIDRAVLAQRPGELAHGAHVVEADGDVDAVGEHRRRRLHIVHDTAAHRDERGQQEGRAGNHERGGGRREPKDDRLPGDRLVLERRHARALSGLPRPCHTCAGAARSGARPAASPTVWRSAWSS